MFYSKNVFYILAVEMASPGNRHCANLLYRRRGVVVSGVRRMNELNARRARLVLRRVTVFVRVYHLCM